MNTVVYKIDTDMSETALQEIIDASAKIICDGGLVGIPTETVYGLGADGLNPSAVQKIFAAKGRAQDNPLILHIPDESWLTRLCTDIPEEAYILARRFWPGPLTIILKRKPIVPLETTGGLETVAIRCPASPITQAIIKAADVPIAAPSANSSGRPSCTTAQSVLEDVGGKIEALIDAGPSKVGVESTIVDLTSKPARLLRPGGLPLEDLEEVLGTVEADPALFRTLQDDERPLAPGMKYRHYAPKASVTVYAGSPEDTAAAMIKDADESTGIICFEEYLSSFSQNAIRSLGPYLDPSEHAHRLFSALRDFDSLPVTRILAQCPDSSGLDLAVTNRLKKSAGFQVIEVS